MELMSSLLFYVFAAVMPPVLGSRSNLNETNRNLDLSFMSKPNYLLQKQILLNLNGPGLVAKSDEINVFEDNECKKCNLCMERAILEHKFKVKPTKRPTSKEMHEELLTSNNKSLFKSNYRKKRTRPFKFNIMENNVASDIEIQKVKEKLLRNDELEFKKSQVLGSYDNTKNSLYSNIAKFSPSYKQLGQFDYNVRSNPREKRQLELTSTKPNTNISKTKVKIDKMKKNNIPSAITVTNYNVNGKTYALKVKESILNGEVQNTSRMNNDTICQVYKVIETFKCGSLEADLLLTSAKAKNRKNLSNKKQKNKRENKTQKISTAKPSLPKPDVTSQVTREDFMSSLEELY